MLTKNANTDGLPFLKMHGAGNDFVIIDARAADTEMTDALARAIGARHFGVGYDQLAVLTQSDGADVDIMFWNSDGSIAGACGNASRCIARLVMEETGQDKIVLRTERGELPAQKTGDLISVNMGQPVFDWTDIPLSEDVDIDVLPIDGAPMAVGMGNPHCVFFVDDVDTIDLSTRGAAIEHHSLYPQRTNVEFVEVISKTNLRQRTWERGAGETLACGSGACAVAVAAHRKGLTGRKVSIELKGGTLDIDWRDDGVWMTGPTELVFEGRLSPEFLARV
ncbi:MAG: diaminopimelate epimerase [Pseudomonadota bacterium]